MRNHKSISMLTCFRFLKANVVELLVTVLVRESAIYLQNSTVLVVVNVVRFLSPVSSIKSERMVISATNIKF